MTNRKLNLFWRTPLSRGLFFVFGVCACLSVVAQEKWQKPDFILHAFSEIALKNEYSQHDGRLRKWQQPLKIWIDHRVGDRQLHEQLVRWHVDELTRITGHSVSLVKGPETANITLVFTRFEDMQRQGREQLGNNADRVLKGALCLANFKTNKEQVIYRGQVVIPVDQARMHGKLVSCVVEELTQIMGLVNDSSDVYPSIFNDHTPDDLLSGLDYILLKILYHKQMQAGMDRDQAVKMARTIILQMQKSGEIESAWKNVSRGELYRLMGFRQLNYSPEGE